MPLTRTFFYAKVVASVVFLCSFHSLNPIKGALVITITRKEGVGDRPTHRVVILALLPALRRLLVDGLAQGQRIVGEPSPKNLVLEDSSTAPSTIVEYAGPEAEMAILVHGALFFLESTAKGITATADYRAHAAMIAAMGYTDDEDFRCVMSLSTDVLVRALERKNEFPDLSFRELVRMTH
ncbi:hypothetical protein HY629_00680 [Candidatus Uhrbacteria bacterium]|nr:hypothetical protein [Candidatus Uhrbacteria bacterium]